MRAAWYAEGEQPVTSPNHELERLGHRERLTRVEAVTARP